MKEFSSNMRVQYDMKTCFRFVSERAYLHITGLADHTASLLTVAIVALLTSTVGIS